MAVRWPNAILHEGANHVPGVARNVDEMGTIKNWAQWALCRDYDPEYWTQVHESGTHRNCYHGFARHICGHCPVKDLCFSEAAEFPRQWTGMVVGGVYWAKSATAEPTIRQPKMRKFDSCPECVKQELMAD